MTATQLQHCAAPSMRCRPQARRRRGAPWCGMSVQEVRVGSRPCRTLPTQLQPRAAWVPCARSCGAVGPPKATQRGGESSASGRCAPAATEAAVASTSYSERPEWCAECVATLSRALVDDPSTAYWCQPGSGASFYEASLLALLLRMPTSARILSVGGTDAAAICYEYPEEGGGGGGAVVSARLLGLQLRAVAAMQPGRWLESGIVGDVFGRKRDAFAQTHGKYTYMCVVGVSPEQQGQGMGGALVQAVCAAADARAQWTYVEATSERAALLYRRFGFVQLEVLQHRVSAPATMLMARAPGRPSTAGI